LGKSYDKALGLRLKIWGVNGVIIGVIKDFHASSLHKKIEPLVITNAKNRFYQTGIKLVPGNTQKEIDIVKKTWLSVYPDNVFTYDFLSTTIEKFYTKDNTTLRFLYIFSGLAILLACLGLFGLVSFLTINRTKEVGIRKVLGASIPSLLGLLSKNFLLLVLFANLISWPVAYYFMNKWLDDFAYKINIGISFFILATVLSLIIAFLTMAYQALKVANANPVKALRYE
jgi:putative ABC transport system permease protein